ncbi:MAG: exodeoxyribonuclease III [Pegethrix bostrychoides GSE-TBD4-15B]|jgi:exodeoxyribonuclease-3|uniref:Exodeoxyribonuclease III n=1 Tax=Pegethrix bostrychoides GSE-TBD4-15B TaxID=2839662 RepID=A0A951P8G7_9CYAN|nr:exodeoxyribonuclease III [Pegethrix bostrychoides GSE-TBD4-15B]
MKIATWNVNSVRSRLDHICQWLEANPVDLLCLQETKVVDPDFPRAAIAALGYQVYIFGQKSYNGVALLSRAPLADVAMGFAAVLGEESAALDEQKRVISGRLGQLCVVNLYVPNGSEIGSEKYDYKLRWLATLRDYLKTLLPQHPYLLVCGDFNVAPEDRDIHNPKGRETHIMSSDAERAALRQSILDLGLVDIFRQFNSESDQFSWWDYRTAAFSRNSGWRIDHHYLSPALSLKAQNCTIDKTPRAWEKPSDHTPVIVELDL